MRDTSDQTAQRIADRGRDVLLARLRPAFEDAARAHADVLELSDETLEQMIQRAADRADGLQWRRALATVATEELGIGLGEALGHPAVARAHEIVGAPSYEDSLAMPAEPEPEPQPEPEPMATSHETPEPVRFSALHLGGVADLASRANDIELHLSEDGLDILRGTDEILGRLRWDEIRALDVSAARGTRRQRREQKAHLVVRTANGEASFEVPAVSPEELRDHLGPLLTRYGTR